LGLKTIKGEIIMGTEVQNTRRTNLQILDDKRNELTQALEANAHLLKPIPVEKQEQFKENFLELVTQDFLINTINAKEIISFAVNVSKIGLNINPAYKEVYIVPFNTKVNGQKIMLPQAIIPLNGMQEMAYSKDFFLKINAVFSLKNGYASEAGMTREQQSEIKTADPKWVNEHFIGFDVVLTDLQGKLPEQVKFVEKSYLIEVTKTIQDNRFQLQTWRHKAARRGIGDMFMPRARAIDVFEKIEHLNDLELSKEDKEEISVKNFEELQKSLSPLNIELAYEDGMAIASGNTFNNAKTMKEIGFKFVNGKYIIASTTPVTDKAIDILPENEVDNPLAEFGLNIVEKKVKGKVYQIVEGETLGLDEILTQNGFSKGQTGKWGKEKNLFDK
jgi:hypothetical protein